MTTHEDRAAIAEYLAVLRDAGPTLEPHLVEAFERLTPAQLDVLAGRLLDPEPVAPPTTASRPRRAGARTALMLGAVFALGLGGVVATSLAITDPHESPATSTTSPTNPAEIDILRGIDWASATNW